MIKFKDLNIFSAQIPLNKSKKTCRKIFYKFPVAAFLSKLFAASETGMDDLYKNSQKIQQSIINYQADQTDHTKHQAVPNELSVFHKKS